MEVPLRTAYGQNGRYGMQPKARQSSRAGAAKTRTETCELVEEKQKLLDIREKRERESLIARSTAVMMSSTIPAYSPSTINLKMSAHQSLSTNSKKSAYYLRLTITPLTQRLELK
ncbi:hypothetical protein TNCV_4460991 [Trichonephila clavipes]|nr:hypothetical protein TNCV_4460991 [Trichonephila clavipes]